MMFGIMLGWSAPVIEYMLENVTSVQFGWIVAMMPLGGACSSIFSGILRTRFGTNLTFFVFGFPILIGYILLTMSQNLSTVG